MAQDKLEEERRSSELGDQLTSQEEVLELLGSNPLLEQLPRSSLMLIAKKVKQIVFGPGDYIAREGEQGEGLYIIMSGEAEVSFSTNAALGQALPILKKGDFFGYVPVYYQIERVRDGYTFAARHVIARQKGQQIFILNASFQKPNEDGPEHQLPMPLAPNPDQVLSFEADFDKSVVDPRIHPNHRRALAIRLVQQLPLDVRLCNPRNRVHPKRMEPREKVWVRARGKLSDDQGLHRCVAAYASDFYFLLVGLRPHALLLGVHAIPLSLDHSLWFHKSFRADEWLLFTIESPRLSNARGLVFGHFYTQSGELVISAAQEGLFWNPNAQKKSAKL
ncbi:hypothetical protein O6H91_14G048400 [Diphasiastrum complanatum]|uniref:Uncharacterized protein n=1 Tax=Diphasiastrum complanatum TaxID=34168 RepID=A0ACC2BPB6_DIPCM|nr:hypothetical protein O6H91_14G048400 [Diphasiastrum complanatum]